MMLLFSSFPLPLAIALFASSLLAKSEVVSTTKLAEQCWHEYPLTTVTLQSLDKESELVTTISPVSPVPAHVPSNNIQSDSGPWTHRPICTQVLKGLNSKLCVYTNASFSNGRGISIITTPETANAFASLPAFRNAGALDGINGFSGAWYTQNLPGRGVGMLAAKQLKFKDRVTAYTPAFVPLLDGDALTTADRERLYRVAVYQLPEATREAYLQLAYVYGQPNVRVQDIVKANTFQLEIGGLNHLAVFPETSRFNHDCAPNAQYYLDPALLTHFVHVTRPISQGEEITIAYTSPLAYTEERQSRLQEGFHFTCSCSRCSAKEKTDSIFRQIQAMQASLNDWSPQSIATPKLAEKMIQLHRKEGLEGFLDVAYGLTALAYNAVGDTRRAEKYAKQAAEIMVIKEGPWTPNVQAMRELSGDPKKHWSFNRRRSR